MPGTGKIPTCRDPFTTIAIMGSILTFFPGHILADGGITVPVPAMYSDDLIPSPVMTIVMRGFTAGLSPEIVTARATRIVKIATVQMDIGS